MQLQIVKCVYWFTHESGNPNTRKTRWTCEVRCVKFLYILVQVFGYVNYMRAIHRPRVWTNEILSISSFSSELSVSCKTSLAISPLISSALSRSSCAWYLLLTCTQMPTIQTPNPIQLTSDSSSVPTVVAIISVISSLKIPLTESVRELV